MSSPSEDQTLPIGAMIEEFRVVNILGTGSFGVVYQCDNTYLDETVAIKEFLPTELAARRPNGRIEPLSSATADPFGWALERFLQEAKTLWSLGRPVRHPNIVRVTRFRKLNGSAYMFMEFEHGRPFSAVLSERGPLAFEELLEVVEPLLSGLQRVHASGILHRDIKPANILIRNDGSPVLIDFGSAKAVAQSGEQSVFATYTPLYAALEQHQDVGDQGPWTDIYGLGATLYRAVTGHPPKSASQRLLSDPQVPATEAARGRYPEYFLQAIDQACSLQPEKRPQSVAEWRAQIFEATRSEHYEPTVVKPKAQPFSYGSSHATHTGDPPASPAPPTSTGPVGTASLPTPSSTPHARNRPFIAVIGVFAIISATVFGWAFLAPNGRTPDTGSSADLGLPPPSPDRPASAENYEALARDHLRNGELTQSLELVDLGLAASPRDPRLLTLREHIKLYQQVQAIRDRVVRALDNGDLDNSLSLINEGLAKAPEHPELLALREKVLEQQMVVRREQAAGLLEQAQAAHQKGDLKNAIALINEGRKLADDDTELLALLAKLEDEQTQQRRLEGIVAKVEKLLQAGDLESAAAALSDALALDADNPQVRKLRDTLQQEQEARQQALVADLIDRAQSALGSGDASKALALTKEGLANAPDDSALKQIRAAAFEAVAEQQARSYLEQATALEREGDFNKSLELVEKGLDLTPEDDALSALRVEIESRLANKEQIAGLLADAQALRRQGNFNTSLSRIEEGLDIEADNQSLLELRDVLLKERRQQNQTEAKGLLERARELAAQDKLGEAVELLDEAASLTPNDGDLETLRDEYLSVLDERAQLAEMVNECNALLFEMTNDLGEVQRTAGCFKRVLQLDPASEVAADGLARTVDSLVEVSTEAIRKRDADLARTSVSLFQTVAPEDARLASIQHDLNLLQRNMLPDMVAIDGGCYLMGSPADEPGRESDEDSHRVCIEPFAIGKQEVTVADFARFVAATGYKTDAERGIGGVNGCWALDRESSEKQWSYQDWATWRSPNKYQEQLDDHPVSCVSWHDAQAYVTWLSEETGRPFRLPTEAEWEYAARAESTGARHWSDASSTCRYANVADLGWKEGFNCRDGNEWVAATGEYAANPWGLHDMLGNLWEWTCSEYEQQYSGNELLCSPEKNREPRAMRGGAWNSGITSVRSAYRNRFFPEARYSFVGFRLAHDKFGRADEEPSTATRQTTSRSHDKLGSSGH